MRGTILSLAAALAGQVSADPTWRGGFHHHRSTNYTAVFAPGLSPGASIWYPNQAGYSNNTVQRASTWDSPDFACTIKPATVGDVSYIIKTANANGMPFYATGGAHSTMTGLSNVHQAVNIDLSNFVNQTIDTNAQTITIQPGLAFYQFATNVADAGFTVPLGNMYCVNMVGATVGAGVGPYSGLYGLVLDALLSVTMVTADGSVVTASLTQNSDLFWAIRGAGANFGVIVSATYQIYPSPNNGNMIVADFLIPGSANHSMFSLIQQWDTNFPPELGLTVIQGYNHTSSSGFFEVQMSYYGPQSGVQPFVNQLVALGPTLWRNVTVRWDIRSETMGFGQTGKLACQRGGYVNQMSIAATQTNVQTYVNAYNQFAEFAAARPWFQGSLWLQRFNMTKAQSVPASQQGVYPGRSYAGLYVIYNIYDGPTHDSEVYSYAKDIRSQIVATSGFSSLQTYINYAFGDEGPAVWYGQSNLPRLTSLKNLWDPHRKFGPGNPIPYSSW